MLAAHRPTPVFELLGWAILTLFAPQGRHNIAPSLSTQFIIATLLPVRTVAMASSQAAHCCCNKHQADTRCSATEHAGSVARFDCEV